MFLDKEEGLTRFFRSALNGLKHVNGGPTALLQGCFVASFVPDGCTLPRFDSLEGYDDEWRLLHVYKVWHSICILGPMGIGGAGL